MKSFVEFVNKAFEKVLSFIRRHSMLDQSTGVMVAVSGGPDSVVLLDVLLRIREQSALAPLRIQVAHLDHRLRRESAEDAEFVRALAQRSSLDITVSAIDVKREAQLAHRGLEETAREIRYRFLLDAARQAGCDRISTGHTMNDQAETFLMRLARGAGFRGLAAMRPVIPAHEFDRQKEYGDEGFSSLTLPHSDTPILLIRPLLGLTREEVEAYCRERGLEFRQDVTNQSLDYARNRVRHSALPALAKINPRIVESIARTAEMIALEEDAVCAIVASMLDSARIAGDEYSVAALMDQPAALRRRMIIEAIRRLDASSRIESKHVAAVYELLEESRSGSRIVLPHDIEVWREFDHLVFCRRSNEIDDYRYRLDSQQARIEAGGLTISLKRGEDANLLSSLREQARRERVERGRDWMMAILDDDRLPESFIVRPRREGERVSVKAGAGAKKLKSLMIDHKIPARRRTTWPVVASREGRYIWSPGMPPEKEIIADDETRRLAILRAEED